ncbi:hypothetical protein [Spiroplasma endosymbiont of Nebria brevicollis]|uniref:hypothetical protein n=1 Tax=Spiroplasma endosymbiont of Nebria brevicollis TaxID=3066284 RepID=UPI00313BC226
MENIFLDTNIFIYLDTEECLSQVTRDSITNFIKNGHKYMFNIVGKKMKYELLKVQKFRNKLHKIGPVLDLINSLKMSSKSLNIYIWNEKHDKKNRFRN